MRKRYSRSADGSIIQTAAVYTADEHGINPQDLDHDAVKVVRRLRRHGYDTYIVGGAVRDLLLGKKPKDFDVSTAATPNQIRKLFRNSRIIGKRFRLAHVLFRDKVIEVSTFRSEDAEGFKNIYGSIEEDVLRRDFTANALFLNPEDNTIVDYVGGVRDVQQRVLRPVIPLPRIFREDPVRMIRAVKYAAAGGMKIPWKLKRRIKKDHALLAETPSSRMTEELFKILNSGYAAGIISMLLEFNLYGAMLPEQARLARSNGAYRTKFMERLVLLDEKRRQHGALERTDLLVFLAADYLLEYSPLSQERRIPFRDAYYALKEFLSPVTPANREVEGAINEIFRNKGRLLRDEAPEHLDARPSRRSRPRRRRRRRSSTPGSGATGAGETT
ncbi:MAG: polynucleotide adenylyltransferase PcnB [Alkalispirochaeta sp.]